MGAQNDRRAETLPGPATTTGRKPAKPSTAGLQRMAGNRAVAQLVARETAAKAKAKPKKPPKPKKETKPAKKYGSVANAPDWWGVDKLRGWGKDRLAEGNLLDAAAYYQYAFEKGRNKDRQLAWEIAQIYKKLPGYEDDYKYWVEVSSNPSKHPLLPEFQHA